MVVSAIQPKGIDMTVTTLEKRIPRGWNKLLWAHILDQLLNARESADLGEMARDLRRNLEEDVLQGDTLRLVELLDHHRRLTPRDERGVARRRRAVAAQAARFQTARAAGEARALLPAAAAHAREADQVEVERLHGRRDVDHGHRHARALVVRALDFPGSVPAPAPAPAPAAEAPGGSAARAAPAPARVQTTPPAEAIVYARSLGARAWRVFQL